MLHHDHIFGVFHRLHVRRVRIGHHVAFARLNLLVTHACVRCDRKDQRFDFRRVTPVCVVAHVTDHGVFLVGLEGERTGADGRLVQHFRRAGFQHRVSIFLGHDRREIHRHVCDDWRFGTGQVELNGIIVNLFNAFDQIWHRHRTVVFPRAARYFVVRVFGVALTVKAKDHVIGVKITRGRELRVAVKLDALAQLERDGFAVFGHVPAFGQRGNGFGCADLEFRQAVVDRVAGRVKGRARCVQGRVKAFGRPFRAIDQRLRLRRNAKRAQQQASGHDFLKRHSIYSPGW